MSVRCASQIKWPSESRLCFGIFDVLHIIEDFSAGAKPSLQNVAVPRVYLKQVGNLLPKQIREAGYSFTCEAGAHYSEMGKFIRSSLKEADRVFVRVESLRKLSEFIEDKTPSYVSLRQCMNEAAS